MKLSKIKEYIYDYLEFNFDEDLNSLTIIREIPMKELSEMDYFEGNSDKKPKNFKELEDKYNSGIFYNHCDVFIAKCPSYEVQGKYGTYCLSKRIFDLKENDWNYELPKGVKEENILYILQTANTYSSKKIMNEFNKFLYLE